MAQTSLIGTILVALYSSGVMYYVNRVLIAYFTFTNLAWMYSGHLDQETSVAGISTSAAIIPLPRTDPHFADTKSKVLLVEMFPRIKVVPPAVEPSAMTTTGAFISAHFTSSATASAEYATEGANARIFFDEVLVGAAELPECGCTRRGNSKLGHVPREVLHHNFATLRYLGLKHATDICHEGDIPPGNSYLEDMDRTWKASLGYLLGWLYFCGMSVLCLPWTLVGAIWTSARASPEWALLIGMTLLNEYVEKRRVRLAEAERRRLANTNHRRIGYIQQQSISPPVNGQQVRMILARNVHRRRMQIRGAGGIKSM